MQEEIEIRRLKKASSEAFDVTIPKRFANLLKFTAESSVILKLTFDKKNGQYALIIYSQDVLKELLEHKLADDKDG